MGTIPESIPYEEFLELRKEVHKVQHSLNLTLRILGGLAGFSSECLTLELHKEFMKKEVHPIIEVLLANKVETNVDFVDDPNKHCATNPLEISLVDPKIDVEVSVNPKSLKGTPISNTKRRILSGESPLMPNKKPLIMPVDITTLLPSAASTQDNTTVVVASALSDIDKECIETNNLLNRLKSNEVSIDIKTVLKIEDSHKKSTRLDVLIDDTVALPPDKPTAGDVNPVPIIGLPNATNTESSANRWRRKQIFPCQDNHEWPCTVDENISEQPHSSIKSTCSTRTEETQLMLPSVEEVTVAASGKEDYASVDSSHPLDMTVREIDRRSFTMLRKRRSLEASKRSRERKARRAKEIQACYECLLCKNNKLKIKANLLHEALNRAMSYLVNNP